MAWETLPAWFWTLYYLFLLLTLGMAIFNVVKGKMLKLSVAAIVYTILIPMVTLINSMGRTEGKNEFEHLVGQLQQGAVWAIFTIAGYFFLLAWWGVFVFDRGRR